MKSDLPELNPGDTVKVFVRIKEGNKKDNRLLKALSLKNKVAVQTSQSL